MCVSVRVRYCVRVCVFVCDGCDRLVREVTSMLKLVLVNVEIDVEVIFVLKKHVHYHFVAFASTGVCFFLW